MSRKLITWLALRGILLGLVTSLAMACATSALPVALQQPQEIQTKSVLETCAVVQDQELAEERGCYDTYSFGMNITGNLDLASKNFSIQTNYTQVIDASQIPSQLKISPTGNMVSFKNENVSFTAGVGQTSLGSGIMNVLQVVGQDIMVIANTNVTLNINNAINLRPTAGGALITPTTLSGIR